MSEEKIIEVRIFDICMWIALITFLIIMAWWVLGSSPTTEIVGMIFTAVGIILTWSGNEKLKKLEKLDLIESNSIKTIELLQKLSEK